MRDNAGFRAVDYAKYHLSKELLDQEEFKNVRESMRIPTQGDFHVEMPLCKRVAMGRRCFTFVPYRPNLNYCVYFYLCYCTSQHVRSQERIYSCPAVHLTT